MKDRVNQRRASLGGRRRTLGEKHPSTALAMNSPAELYKQEGKYARAESFHTRALEMQRSVINVEHPNTLFTATSLASLYETEGKYGQAEPLFTRAGKCGHLTRNVTRARGEPAHLFFSHRGYGALAAVQ